MNKTKKRKIYFKIKIFVLVNSAEWTVEWGFFLFVSLSAQVVFNRFCLSKNKFSKKTCAVHADTKKKKKRNCWIKEETAFVFTSSLVCFLSLSFK